MRNKLEHLFLSILLGITILLGLSFWLNTFFNFNIFQREHWNELAELQASQIPINNNFYISIGVAIFIFALGLFLIHRQGNKDKHKKESLVKTHALPQQTTDLKQKPEIKNVDENLVIQMNRPPRLKLPSNMAQIAAQHQTLQGQTKNQIKSESSPSTNPYNPMISEIFSNNGYVIKPNPTISGFIPNLFAIGTNEVVWIGGVDCDIEKMKNSVQKLNKVFQETLEDIPININSFVLDTMNRYNTNSDNILIFKTIDELKNFINEHPSVEIDDDEKENFDSYSEYIDTIIQYIKNI